MYTVRRVGSNPTEAMSLIHEGNLSSFRGVSASYLTPGRMLGTREALTQRLLGMFLSNPNLLCHNN